jgi:hypothetical protein
MFLIAEFLPKLDQHLAQFRSLPNRQSALTQLIKLEFALPGRIQLIDTVQKLLDTGLNIHPTVAQATGR